MSVDPAGVAAAIGVVSIAIITAQALSKGDLRREVKRLTARNQELLGDIETNRASKNEIARSRAVWKKRALDLIGERTAEWKSDD